MASKRYMGDLKTAVVAAMVHREGRFLMGRRAAGKASAPGVWCAVMGRVEAGESEAEAVVREVREEVGLRVRAVEKVCSAESRDGSALIHWWVAAPLDDESARLANQEHSELRWVTVAEMERLQPVFLEDVRIFSRFVARAGSAGVGGGTRPSG